MTKCKCKCNTSAGRNKQTTRWTTQEATLISGPMNRRDSCSINCCCCRHIYICLHTYICLWLVVVKRSSGNGCITTSCNENSATYRYGYDMLSANDSIYSLPCILG